MNKKTLSSVKNHKLSKQFMPYVIEELAENKFVILNRNYKPIGLRLDCFVDYEDYSIFMKLTKKDKSKFITHDHAPNMYWLYDDLTNPFLSKKKSNKEKYFELLDLLNNKSIYVLS